jgi:hypothetical protein
MALSRVAKYILSFPMISRPKVSGVPDRQSLKPAAPRRSFICQLTAVVETGRGAHQPDVGISEGEGPGAQPRDGQLGILRIQFPLLML